MKTNCPNCGAPVKFRFAQAVQTTCDYCKAILVRMGTDLTKVGEIAELPPDPSPIQLGTEGVWGNGAFVVVGRIAYRYECGAWNEWHLSFNDGRSGWLSDAQAQYAVSFLAKPDAPLPEAVERGEKFVFGGAAYEVTSITKAQYVGVQGELPFEYWDKSECTFADLRSADARFGTIDYTEAPPLLFLGRAVSFDELRLKNLKEFEGW